jgi:hypothetical protein
MPQIIDQTHKYKVYSSWYQRNERDIKYLTIHHSAWPHNSMGNEPRLHEMKGWHHKKGWPGLSYHYAIMRDGSIYKLNNHNDITWHDGRNNDTLGILVDGYFHPPHNEKPSKEQLESLDWLITKLLKDLNLPRNRVKGHRDFGRTACPGDLFYPTVQKLSKNPLNNNIMSDKYNKLKSGIVEKLEKEANKGLPLDDGNKFGHQRGLIWVEDDPLKVFNQVFDAMASQTEKVEKLEAQLDEAPEAAVVEQLQAKQEEIDQLKQALDDQTEDYNKMKARVNEVEENRKGLKNRTKELESELETANNRRQSLKQELERAMVAELELLANPEKFDWNKFLVGLSKDQTFQRGLRHTITFAIGVLASQFPEYAPYILGLAGVWGLGTEVQAFQVNQKQIVKEKK